VAGQPIGVGIDPVYLAYGLGAVWGFDSNRLLAEVDAQHLTPIGSPRRFYRCFEYRGNIFGNPALPHCDGTGLAVVGNEIWVGLPTQGDSGPILRRRTADGSLAPSSRGLAISAGRSIPHVYLGSVFVQAQHTLWANSYTHINRIDERTHAVTRIPLAGQQADYAPGLGGLTVGFGYAWYASATGGLYQCSFTQPSCQELSLSGGATGITASKTALWVSMGNGRVLELSPIGAHIVHTYRLGHTTATAITYANGDVWVALASP
jgi:hypothetical protein